MSSDILNMKGQPFHPRNERHKHRSEQIVYEHFDLSVPSKAYSWTDPNYQHFPGLSLRHQLNTTEDSRVETSRLSTSTTGFNPDNSALVVAEISQSTILAKKSKPKPIQIPRRTLTERDINRVPTPLSDRGDCPTHLFPFSRSSSPRSPAKRSSVKCQSVSSNSDGEGFFGRIDLFPLVKSVSSSRRRVMVGNVSMHNEPLSTGRYPTSPLSPRPAARQSLSPQNSPRRGNHGRQASRNMPSNLGRFHPSKFTQADSVPSSPPTMHLPQITYSRAPQAVMIESPRLLRDKHREFLEKAKLTSKLAASPLAIKPDAPRLDPLGSPTGLVTPLELEDASDYFSVPGAGGIAPVVSPGSRSPRSRSCSDDDEAKISKSRKINI